MKRFKYLIVGGGMTADSAAKAIHSVDADGAIGMIADEPDPPYDRPPLSKGLWKGKTLESVWRNTKAHGVDVIAGRKAVALDPPKQTVVDDQGVTYRYERLLLATGGNPKRHPSDGSVPIYYRTLADYRKLRALAEAQQRFVVVGGGFIGSEVAAALALNGKSVTMAFIESGVCGRIFPREIALAMNTYYEERGVRVIPNVATARCEPAGGLVNVYLENGEMLTAQAVVAGLGIAPNVALAAAAGLAVGDGIVVDECLQTNRPNIFAAGDVANFPCPALDKRARLEHEDNANAMGALAGRNMAGEHEAYRYLPYFYSDLFDVGYEAIGETDPAHRTVIEWSGPKAKGVVFYTNQGRVRGVLMWNLFGKLEAARELIAAPGPFRDAELKAWAMKRV